MKQSSLALILFTLFLFVLRSHSGSALFLATRQDDQPARNDWMTGAGSWKEEDVLLMGLESCHDENDEECVTRRMVAEAHLDYIYTQHHKP